jgi:dynein heavy chain 1
LQTLKSEAADIARKVVKTEEVMVEVQNIMNQYEVIASACTTIYVILEQLGVLNHFYRFSLDYFQEIFRLVLASRVRYDKAPEDRIAHLVNQLYITTFRWTSRSLLHKDHLALALLLAQAASTKVKQAVFTALLTSGLKSGDEISLDRIDYGVTQHLVSHELEKLLSDNRAEWNQFFTGADSEATIPSVGSLSQGKAFFSFKH